MAPCALKGVMMPVANGVVPLGMLLFDFRFQSFAQPLLHHALVIEKTGAGDTLDPSQ